MIVLTEIDYDDAPAGSDKRRLVFYKCQDSSGAWHNYGPVITTDPAFDAEAFKAIAAARVAVSLAVAEFDGMIG